jgi:hypothetical protein
MHFADAAPILAGLFPATDARFRACVRKRIYPTFEAALAVKEKRECLTGLTLRVYRCEYADEPDGHWHLSSHELTDAQQARMEARAQAYVRDVIAECEAHEATLRTIRREVLALRGGLERRAKRIERARSVSAVTTLYAEQREDLHRLFTRLEEGLDTELTLRQLKICFYDIVMSEKPRTLEAYREVRARLQAAVDQAEHAREINATHLAEYLAGLEAREREDIAWIRQQINHRYALPAMPWQAGRRP